MSFGGPFSFGPFSEGPRRVVYAIPDEPAPSRYQRFVVQPSATLLGVMLGGSLLGLPWMVFNGYAMGSAFRRKELLYAVVTAIAQFGLLGLLIYLTATGVFSKREFGYASLLVHAVRLTGAYFIYASQEKSFDLYQHFGGPVNSKGMFVALVMMVAKLYLVGVLPVGVWSILVRF